jgi:hypothetical protein
MLISYTQPVDNLYTGTCLLVDNLYTGGFTLVDNLYTG